MKKNLGLILATMLSTAVLAQTPPPGASPTLPPPGATPPAPDTSASATPPALTPPESTSGSTTNTAPVKKHKKKSAKKKEAVKEAKHTTSEFPPAEPLVPGEPAAARQNNVNIRGQAHINSEVVGHLQKGETVTVLEEVTLQHPKTDEPAKWAKIALPASMHVWVNSSFVDSTNQTVSARKLNLRTGPGENYSVIGTLQKGDAVKSTGATKGDWTQIEAPTNSFAFVAAHLLTHKAPEAPAIAANPTPTPPPITTPTPTPTEVQNPATIAPPPSSAPANPVPVAVNPVQPAVTLPPVAPPVAPPADEPPPKRIIEREGLVGGTVSIQAPSHFELKSIDDGRVMEYLYTTSSNLDLKRYKGLTVLVTGEEELDERWPNTPVLTIQKIQVVK